MSLQVDLPKIPSLPPIEMPDTASLLATSSTSHEDLDSLSPLPPSSNFTANSPFASSSGNTAVPSSSSHLAPPTSLRKSISVDSFIKFRHHTNHTTRSTRGNTTSATAAPIAHPPSFPPLREPRPAPLRREHSYPAPAPVWRDVDRLDTQPSSSYARTRGTGTSADDREPPMYLDDSDLERSDDLRRDTVQHKLMTDHTVREGELTLPSRLPPAPSPPTLPTASDPIVPTRSSSLSHKKAKQRVQVTVNTHVTSSRLRTEVVIAVVGVPGSGRTAVVRKGLKAYGLSDMKTASVPVGRNESGTVFNYAYRVGRILHAPADTQLPLRVLELDIGALDLSQTRATQLCPEGVPAIDGLVICYDASQDYSFSRVADLIRAFAHLRLPSVVLACKSDLEKQVDPHRALSVLKSLSVSTNYDVGLVETSIETESGRQKIRMAFEWIFQTLLNPEVLLISRDDPDIQYNPASPAILTSNPAPWDINRAESATPTASSSLLPPQPPPQRQRLLSHASPPSGDLVHQPNSPTRARSTSDLLSEARRGESEHDWDRNAPPGGVVISLNGSRSGASLQVGNGPIPEALRSLDGAGGVSREVVATKETRAPPWVTLPDLLNKLLFLAVSDDDATFISHFLLTYRRFTTPRSILLAMQKRMRALDEPLGDPMFACFAQMKICCLLDHWITLYPNDFAVPGTAGALSALLKSILGKTYLLQYGSDFIPFMEMLPTLRDLDASWALKVEDPKYDSDDSSSLDVPGVLDSPVSSVGPLPEVQGSRLRTQSGTLSRDRKSSLPLSTRSALVGSSILSPHMPSESLSHKAVLKRLQSICTEINQLDPADIAEEITRLETDRFLRIMPRHWMQHVLAQGKKDPHKDPIASYNGMSNHIGHWVLSLILCHDKPKARAKQIERFTHIASRLRSLNNYSALRAVVAGINGATFEGDETIDIFKSKNPEQWKVFQSFDHLLQAVRSHQKYRMALRNTSGACIPALEIHLSDLIRAHEGNADFYEDDPERIHWAKFHMIGRFIDVITQSQTACRETGSFNFPPRSIVAQLLMIDQPQCLMDEELQRVRTSAPDWDALDDSSRPNHRSTRDHSSLHRDSALLKRIFFW